MQKVSHPRTRRQARRAMPYRVVGRFLPVWRCAPKGGRITLAALIGPGEVAFRGEGELQPPDRRDTRKVIKAYVGPETPGVIFMGPSLVGRPGLDDDVEARLRAQYAELLEMRGKLIARDRDIAQVIKWGEEEDVTVTPSAARDDVVAPVRRAWKQRRRK